MYTESKRSLALVFSAAVILGVLSCGGSVVFGAEDLMLPEVNYPHAGVSIALPKGFTSHVSADAMIILRGGLVIGRQPAQAVTLSAFCVGPKMTASAFADLSEKALKEQLSVRKFQPLKSVPIKVAGIAGVARLLKYTYNGGPTTAAKVFFVRELKGQNIHLCYVLTVEVSVKYERTLLPTLDKVIKGIKLTTVQAPSSITTRLSDRKLSDFRGGFSIRVPEGWYGSTVKGGMSIGQKNYLIGGLNSPQVAVLSSAVKSDMSARAFAKMALSKPLAATTQPDGNVELVSEGPVKVGKQDAYQYVLRITEKIQPATQPTSSSKPVDKGKTIKLGKIEAVRVVCRSDSNGKAVRAYLFALSCLDSDVKLVTPWFEVLSKGFEHLPLPDKPAVGKKPAAKSTTPKP
jgi:hypothetical protein